MSERLRHYWELSEEEKNRLREASARYKAQHREEVRRRQMEYYWANHEKRRASARASYNKLGRPNRIYFTPAKRQMDLPEAVNRTGVCSVCYRTVTSGQISTTHMHHTRYDVSHPLAHTIEVCVSCHMKIERNKPETKAKNSRMMKEIHLLRRFGVFWDLIELTFE